jgi:hypothetical protein
MPALTRRRDPDANQGITAMSRSAVSPCALAFRPTRTNGAGASASIRPQIAACVQAGPPSRSMRPARPSMWHGSGCSPSSQKPISGVQAAPRLRCMEARDVGCGPQNADAGGGWSVSVLLRCRDRCRGCRGPRPMSPERFRPDSKKPSPTPILAAWPTLSRVSPCRGLDNGSLLWKPFRPPF